MSEAQGKKSIIDWLSLAIVGLIVLVSVGAIGMGMYKQYELRTVDRQWHEDKAGFEEALAEHNKTGKPMVVYFHAPWCPHCKEFNEAILDTDKMVLFLGKNYIKTKIFPEQDAERILMYQFGASGFPTFFIKYANSDKFYRLERGNNRQMFTPDEFIEQMKKAETGEVGLPVVPDFNTIPDMPTAGQAPQWHGYWMLNKAS